MTNQTNNDSKISGEGNYEAAKRFDDDEMAFVKDRGNELPALPPRSGRSAPHPKCAEAVRQETTTMLVIEVD